MKFNGLPTTSFSQLTLQQRCFEILTELCHFLHICQSVILKQIFFKLQVCGGGLMCATVLMYTVVNSLLRPCGSQRWNSGLQDRLSHLTDFFDLQALGSSINKSRTSHISYYMLQTNKHSLNSYYTEHSCQKDFHKTFPPPEGRCIPLPGLTLQVSVYC